jgi:hypothetical protein
LNPLMSFMWNLLVSFFSEISKLLKPYQKLLRVFYEETYKYKDSTWYTRINFDHIM